MTCIDVIRDCEAMTQTDNANSLRAVTFSLQSST